MKKQQTYRLPVKGLLIRLSLITWLSLQLQPVLAQHNLLPNPGFEKFMGKGLYLPAAKPWKNIYTVDYYHQPFKLNNDKKVEPHSGKSFVGLRYQSKYQEYMLVKLDSVLKPGHVYTVELWFCMGEWSTRALKSLGVCFSKKQLNQQQVEEAPPESKVEVRNRKGLIGDYKWTKLTMQYKAQGGEKFITFGNMAPNVDKDMVRIGKLFSKKEAYYFMDDVALYDNQHADTSASSIPALSLQPKAKDSLHPAPKNTAMDTTRPSGKDLNVGQIIKLHNVFFESGNAELLEESFDELDYMVQFLNENPDLEVRVNGHTDNSGYALNNQTLSDQRAYAVYNYLLRKGVKGNITYKGFGATKPLATNSTPAGRARNRRVELEVIKK